MLAAVLGGMAAAAPWRWAVACFLSMDVCSQSSSHAVHACNSPILPKPCLQAALRLYRGSGFSQHGEELPPAEEGQGVCSCWGAVGWVP